MRRNTFMMLKRRKRRRLEQELRVTGEQEKEEEEESHLHGPHLTKQVLEILSTAKLALHASGN